MTIGQCQLKTTDEVIIKTLCRMFVCSTGTRVIILSAREIDFIHQTSRFTVTSSDAFDVRQYRATAENWIHTTYTVLQ